MATGNFGRTHSDALKGGKGKDRLGHKMPQLSRQWRAFHRILHSEKNWRRGSGSNRRIKVLQTSPLPLGYRALAGQPQNLTVRSMPP